MFLRDLALEDIESHLEEKAKTVKNDHKKDEKYLTINNIKKITREAVWLFNTESQWKIRRKIYISVNAEVLFNNILYLKFMQNRQLVIMLSVIAETSNTIKQKQNEQEQVNHENQKDSRKNNVIRCLNELTSEDE